MVTAAHKLLSQFLSLRIRSQSCPLQADDAEQSNQRHFNMLEDNYTHVRRISSSCAVSVATTHQLNYSLLQNSLNMQTARTRTPECVLPDTQTTISIRTAPTTPWLTQRHATAHQQQHTPRAHAPYIYGAGGSSCGKCCSVTHLLMLLHQHQHLLHAIQGLLYLA